MFSTRLSGVAADAVVQRAMRHTSPETKRRYQLGMITDLLQDDGTDRSQLKLAVGQALRRGLIVRKEIERMPHNALHRSLEELAGQVANAI